MEAARPYLLTQTPPSQSTRVQTPPSQSTRTQSAQSSTTAQLSPQNTPKKYAKFRQNNNSAFPKRNEPSVNEYSQNGPVSTPIRSQNNSISTAASFKNDPISTSIRTSNDPSTSGPRSHENPFPRRPPNNSLISAIGNHLNQPTPKISQANAGAPTAPSVDSLTIVVKNNTNPPQRIVQNDAAHPVTVEGVVAPARTHQFRFPQARPFQYDPPHQKRPQKKYAPEHPRAHVRNMEHVGGESSYQQRLFMQQPPQQQLQQPQQMPKQQLQQPKQQLQQPPQQQPKQQLPQQPQQQQQLKQQLQQPPQQQQQPKQQLQQQLPQQQQQQLNQQLQQQQQSKQRQQQPPQRRPIWRDHRERQRQRNYDDDYDDSYKVIVTGFPAYTKPEELVRKLAVLGTPQIEIIKNRVAVILFRTEQEVRTALQANDTIAVYGTILSILKYTNRRHVMDMIRANKRVVRNEHKGPPVAAPTEIDLTGDFGQQMQNIEDAIRLTQEEVDNINLLFEDIEKYMRMIFPTCEAVPFGSITTGLGIKSSDADCFLSLEPGQGGRVGAGAGELCSQFVSRAARLLRLYPDVFSRLVPIPRANTPIIKFLHVPTNVNCDLNSKTPLGVQNSRLVGHLLRADARFGSAALLLKYWARVHQLSGTGRLTNYALLLLLVFYLQRDLLPPVCKLQGPEHSFIVENWEAGFDRSPLPFMREVPPLRDLLGGFFLYYADFNFNELVVCPLVGRPLRKAEFESNVLPPPYALYRRNIASGLALPVRTSCCVCVQDPFELSHNVASAVSGRLAADIRAHIKLAATAYSQEEKTPGEFLRTVLLTSPPSPEAGEERAAARVSLPARLLQALGDDWQHALRHTVRDLVFRDLLFVELTRQHSVSREPGVDLELYYGVVKRPIWRRSHSVSARGASAADLLAGQKEGIARIAQNCPNLADISVPFEMELGFRSKPRGFFIITTPLEGADEDNFRSFRKFAHIFIHRWHKELLKPHLTPDPVRQEPVKTEKAKSPKKSPKRTSTKKQPNENPSEPVRAIRSGPTRADPPIESVAFVNSNHKDLSESIAAISLIDSSKQNSRDSDDAT